MAQVERELNDSYSQIGKDTEFFNMSDDMLELDVKYLRNTGISQISIMKSQCIKDTLRRRTRHKRC
jgi:hypothetical protein